MFGPELPARVGPRDRSRVLVAVGDKGKNAVRDSVGTGEVVRGQGVLLQDAEENLDLVEPRRAHRQPMQLDGNARKTLGHPLREILGPVRRPVVEDEMDPAGALLQGGGEEVTEEGAELHEALVRDHRPGNLPAPHVERGDQMNGPAPFVGMLEVRRLVPPRWRVGEA